MLTKNGFSLPLHPFQIISWLIELWHLLIPIFFTTSNFEAPEIISLNILFYVSSFFVIFAGFLCTKSIPSIDITPDPIFLETGEGLCFFCTVCNSYVTRKTKHCGSCNRCVEGFDHHCKWLNNCIGRKNYFMFIFLIVSLDFNVLMLLTYEIASISETYEYKYPVLVTDVILNFVILILISYLISLHIYLRLNSLTTYEYIKMRKIKNTKKITNYTANHDVLTSANNSHRAIPPNSPVHKSCVAKLQKEEELHPLRSASQDELIMSKSFDF